MIKFFFIFPCSFFFYKMSFKKRDEIAVNPALLDCDYYRFAELDAGAVNAYANEYMSQYYWAEFMTDDWE